MAINRYPLVGSTQQLHDQAGQDQADLPDVPAGVGEESVKAGTASTPGQASPRQHPAHRSFHRAEDESDEI